jgi:vacuolar-type H+-ATPase subunit C/Vma6
MPKALPGGCRIPPRDVDAAVGKSWEDLAQTAYREQLSPHEKGAPKGALSEVDNHSARKDRLPKA